MATYNDMDHDILREIGNIGSGHASVAMSILTNKKARISHTLTNITTPSSVLETELSARKPIDVIHLGIEGDLKGDCLLLLFNESAGALDKIISKEKRTKLNDPSTLNEFGNILIGSYLNALSNLINLEAIPTIPKMRPKQTKAKKKDLLSGFTSETRKKMISIKTQLTIKELKIDTAILIFFTEDSIQKILNRTKLKNVLIIDDSSMMRTKLKKVFEDFDNLKIYSTDSMKNAKDLFEEVKPNVCFIDLVMKDKSGIDLLRTLQKKKKDTTFIVMSSVGSKIMQSKIEKTGAHFFKKPVKKADLLSLIDVF